MSLAKAAGLSVLLLLTLCGFPGHPDADAAPPAHAAEPLPARNVLIIFPFNQDFPIHVQLAKGFRERLARAPEPVRITYEYLDLSRFGDQKGYLAEVARFLERKHAVIKPDVVVSGGPFREFLDTYAAAMFPGVPVVFPKDVNAALEAAPDKDFSASRQSEYLKSVDVIFKVRPSTKKVYVVLGDSGEERDILANMRRVAESNKDRAQFIFTCDMPYGAMLDLLRGADKDGAVLFMRWLRDVNGESFVPEDAQREVCAASGAPVFGVVSSAVGAGAVGGYLFSFELFGRRLAEDTLAVLAGGKPDAPAPAVPVSEYAFDWRQLQRWNIPETSLPEGSRVLFRESSLWDDHKVLILAGLGVILLEAVLVGALVANRMRRVRVERQMLVLNATLEEEVTRRTRELGTANAELTRAKTLLEDMNGRLDLASRTDSLTGLHNRRHMEEVFDREQARYLSTGQPYAVIMCDIDFFKGVNDAHGHQAGDELLRHLAGDLLKTLRPGDTLARWGGEEFMFFLPGAIARQAEERAGYIRACVAARTYVCAGKPLRITMTLGVACVTPGESVDEVLKRADDALYEGKRAGRDRVVAG